jgi:diadenosine tetraphosphate (Ap4A) HIT family hydrolase
MKRDRDDTDFRGIARRYQDRDVECIFCGVDAARIIAENELCFVIRDKHPVTPLHALVIPKRHVSDYFDLYQPEFNALNALLSAARREIAQSDSTVSGFNVGINSGQDSGQTIYHVHVHIIPRRKGDVANPRGGVRGIIPGKAHY